ncbi:MAG: hypothetical protein KJ831_06295 [Candidatus Eisenbacteria bacterium]|nr:hypothetical protein [Candidatus Eisenbacteria bacterium]
MTRRKYPVWLLSILLLMGAMAPAPSVWADGPELRAEIQKVRAPLITVESIDDGYVEIDQSRGNVAVSLEIDPGESTRGWILTVRSDQEVFNPVGTGKPCSDLMWKLDNDGKEAYRRLESHETVVVENPQGGAARITLDSLVKIDWETDPGAYSLGLIFRVTYI